MSGLIPYKRVLPIGGLEIISARGVLIVYHEGQGALKVTATQNQTSGKSGEHYTLTMKRRDQWLFPDEFDLVRIENETGHNMSVELLIGYGNYVLAPPEVPVGDVFSSRGPLVVAATGTLILAYDSKRFLARIKKVKTVDADFITLAGNRADAIAGRGFRLSDADRFGVERSRSLDVRARGELWGASANKSVYIEEFAYTYNSPDSEHPPVVDPIPDDNPAPPPPVGLTFQVSDGANSSNGPYDNDGDIGTSWIAAGNYGAGVNGEPIQQPVGVPGGVTTPAAPLSLNSAQLCVWGSVGIGPNWYWTVCFEGAHPQDFFTSVDFETASNGHKQILSVDADFNTTMFDAGYTVWAWLMPFTGVPGDLPQSDSDVVIA